MSDSADLRRALADPLDRALAGSAEALRATERGDLAAGLWAVLEELGLPLALVPEAAGGAGLGWSDVAEAVQVLGRHGAPLPLGEAMLANALLARDGGDPVAGIVALEVAPGAWAFGRHAGHLLRATEEAVTLHAAPGLAWQTGGNIGREPRDRPSGLGPALRRVAAPREALLLGGALLRALQVAGAAAAVLGMTVEYANTRRQFGREIGRFQAVQQLVARMAGEVAACTAAAEGAAAAADRLGLDGAGFEIAVAKVMAGEAAALAAEVAHQVHGAIGITDEHALHRLTRRLWSWRAEFGSDAFWARRLGTAAIAEGGAALWPMLTARGQPAT